MSCGVFGGQNMIAVNATWRGLFAKLPAAFAGADEGLPFCINHLMGYRDGRHGGENAAGIAECGQGATPVAIGIGVISEAGMQEGVVVATAAIFTVAFVQRKHGHIIARFGGEFEDQVDREGRHQGS